jgi:aminopeptidase 2
VLAGAQHDKIEASDIHRDSKLERAIIDFPANTVNLVPGQKYTLSLRFESALGDTLMGYYRSTHKQSDGSIGFDGVTLFAPTAARKALPCFDEPDMKATFAVTLLSREGLTVLSNMPAKSIQAGVDAADFFIGDSTAAPAAEDRSISSDQSKFGADSTPASKDHRWTATTFQTTPKMSTYLLAWAKGDFRHLESSYTSPLTGRKVPLRIYASPEHIHQAQLTLDVTAKVLPVYEKLFDIEYPLPKLDTLVANDYESGAMENWGFISGATIAYLFDDKNGSIQSKKVVANIQSHGEVALCNT